MTNFTLRKGNLYNHLDNRIDKKIIDSNQYDLELQINNKKEYYIIRLNGDRFEAWSINISEKEFFLPRFSSFCKVSELESFRSTEFYKYYFRYYNLFEKRLSITPDKAYVIRRPSETNTRFKRNGSVDLSLKNQIRIPILE